MAGTTTHPTAYRTIVADAVDTALGTTAKLVFRTSGNANAPGTEVATLSFANPAFGNAVDGVITRTASITSDTDATGGIVATATLETGAGTVIVHTTVGTSGDAINLSGGLTVGAGDTVACSDLTYSAMP